jgi:hypothetical protein
MNRAIDDVEKSQPPGFLPMDQVVADQPYSHSIINNE